jgi:hypothetical protein
MTEIDHYQLIAEAAEDLDNAVDNARAWDGDIDWKVMFGTMSAVDMQILIVAPFDELGGSPRRALVSFSVLEKLSSELDWRANFAGEVVLSDVQEKVWLRRAAHLERGAAMIRDTLQVVRRDPGGAEDDQGAES